MMFDQQNHAVPQRPLIAYAFLAQASHHNDGDFLTGLMPIFRPLVKQREGGVFDPKEFSDALAQTYGIAISPWAAEELAPRLERANLLVRTQLNKYVTYRYAVVEQSYGEVQEGEIRALLTDFIDFARGNFGRFKINIDDQQQLENAFLDHLITTNFYHILQKPDRTKEDRKASKTISLPKSEEQKKWEEEVSYEGTMDVLIASYIYSIQETKKPLYELLIKIANGALMAEVILNFREPEAGISLDGLIVILDAPFIMAFLDLCEEESFVYAKELIEKLLEHNATVATLAHYCEEIKENLDSAIERFERGIREKATDRRLSEKSFLAYATEVRTKPRETLREHGIRVIDHHPTETSYQFFSEEDETGYFNTLGNYHNRKAQLRDASSVATTVRLRRGKTVSMSEIGKSGYLFVTNNPWIPERTVQYLAKRNLYNDGEVPPVISDRYLAGLIWVLFGGSVGDIGRLRLLANCAQALEARADVINKVHSFLLKSSPAKAQRFLAAMTNERASHHLMQLSLGDSRLLNDDNLADIFHEFEQELESKHIKIAEELIEKERIRSEQERNRITKEKDEELNGVRATADRLRADYLDSQAAALAEQQKVADLTDRLSKMEAIIGDHQNEQKNLVEKHMRFAVQRRQIYEHRLTVAVSLWIALITYVGTMFAVESFTVRVILTMLPSILGYVYMGRNHERLFSSYLNKLRDYHFDKSIANAGLEVALMRFDLDWKNAVAIAK